MTRSVTFSDTMNAPGTRSVFAALEAHGGAGCVRFVGGCVRNLLLGMPVSDLDLSTQLTPDGTEAALAAAGIRSVPTGKAYGTITAVVDGTPYEITSLREDVETDGRRAVVKYTDDWGKDAQRRDFYVNALYADIAGTVYDPTGRGLDDIAARRVRFIGDAEQRIREDYLRILRFFRFTAAYGDEIDQDSLEACVALKDGISRLSGERVWQELFKILALPGGTKCLAYMALLSVLSLVLPGTRFDRNYSFEILNRVAQATDVTERRFMALLDEGGALDAINLEEVYRRLRFPKVLYHRLIAVKDVVAILAEDDSQGFGRLVYVRGLEAVEDAVYLIAAHENRSPAGTLKALRGLNVPGFPLKGADLIARGMKPGPEVGQRLKQIETEWLNHDFSQSVIDRALDALAK